MSAVTPAPFPTLGATVQALGLCLSDGDIGIVPLVPQGADPIAAPDILEVVGAACFSHALGFFGKLIFLLLAQLYSSPH